MPVFTESKKYAKVTTLHNFLTISSQYSEVIYVYSASEDYLFCAI